MEKLVSLSVVSMKTALKYRRGWNKESPTVKLLQSLMPRSQNKGFRIYLPIGGVQEVNRTPVVPLAVKHALRVAGFKVSDYLAKKCVKLKDKEQKNFFNIGKVISKDAVAKAAFDNDPQLQNSNSSGTQIVVSCHPYDIIGMSTGRSWDNTSCMRLADNRPGMRDGAYKEHLENDVAEGTLVAYAIRTDDNNIKQPLCRCLLKPFTNGKGDILFRRESDVYGNAVPGFDPVLHKFLRRLNAKVPAGSYSLVEGLYDDGVGDDHDHTGDSEHIRTVDWDKEENPVSVMLGNTKLFPSFVTWELARTKKEAANQIEAAKAKPPEGETPIQQRRRLQRERNKTKRTPWQYLTQQLAGYSSDIDSLSMRAGARVLANSPEFMATFLTEMPGYNSQSVRKFFRSRDFRKAIEALAEEGGPDFDELSVPQQRTMTFASPDYAHKYTKTLKDLQECTEAATDYMSGNIRFNKRDVLRNEMLHACIWLTANRERERMPYVASHFNTQVHKILSAYPQPKEISTEVKRGVLTQFVEDQENQTVLVWGLQAVKADPDFFAEIADKWETCMEGQMDIRRTRRELFKLADKYPNVAAQVGNEISRSLIHDEDLGAEVRADIMDFLSRHGARVNSFSRYIKMIAKFPEMAPKFYVRIKTDDVGNIDDLLDYGVNTWLRVWKDVAAKGEKVVADNADQQNMFDFLGTIMQIQAPPVVAPFEYSDAVVMPLLLQSEYLLATGADFHLFPDRLNGDAVSNISVESFLREDNGARSLEIFAKKASNPSTFISWVSEVTNTAAATRHVCKASGVPFVRGHRDPFIRFANSNTAEACVEKFQLAINYLQKVLAFVTSMPNDSRADYQDQVLHLLGIGNYEEMLDDRLRRSIRFFAADMHEVFGNIKDCVKRISRSLEESHKGIESQLAEIAQPLRDAMVAYEKTLQDEDEEDEEDDEDDIF